MRRRAPLKLSRVFQAVTIGALLVCGQVFADITVNGQKISGPSDNGIKTPQETINQIEHFLNKVPGGSRLTCMLQDFAGVVRPAEYGSADETAMSNDGLTAFVASLASQTPTFQTQLKSFYDEVGKKIYRPKSPDLIQKPKPRLNQNSGDSEHSDLPAGWLWNLAMKHANSNPLRAIELIGACGHDDQVQGNIPVPRTQSEEEMLYKKRLDLVNTAIADAKRRLETGKFHEEFRGSSAMSGACDYSNPKEIDTTPGLEMTDQELQGVFHVPNCDNKNKFRNGIDALTEYKNGLSIDTFKTGKLNCPGGGVVNPELSNFFLSKSLGHDIDISDSLKQKIAKTSDLRCDDSMHVDPAACIPSKNYHIYGSALVACEMISKGHNPKAVIELSKLSGWYYRILWLNKIAEENTDSLQISEKQNVEKILNGLDVFKNFVNSNVAKPSCGPQSEAKPNQANLRDALSLLRRWTISGNLGASLGDMYTDLMISPVGKLDLRYGLNLDQPTNWSQDRFDSAKAELKSIMTDFEWTIEQHRIGAEFAAKVCKPDPLKISNACGKAR